MNSRFLSANSNRRASLPSTIHYDDTKYQLFLLAKKWMFEEQVRD